jgi:hypothetical protein
LSGMQGIDGHQLRTLLRGYAADPAGVPHPAQAPVVLPALAARKRIVRDLLEGWASLLRAAGPECVWDPRAGEPGPEATPLSISYMTEPRPVMEARRLHRLGRVQEASDSARRLLAQAADHLVELARRASDAV